MPKPARMWECVSMWFPLSGQSLPWTATTAQQGSRCDAMSLNILLFFGLCVKFPCHLLSVRFVVVVVVTWPVVRPHDGLVLNAACDVKFKCDCWSLKKCCLCVLWCFKKYCPFMFIVCFEEYQRLIFEMKKKTCRRHAKFGGHSHSSKMRLVAEDDFFCHNRRQLPTALMPSQRRHGAVYGH